MRMLQNGGKLSQVAKDSLYFMRSTVHREKFNDPNPKLRADITQEIGI